MAFSDPVVYEAWVRATGRCECSRAECGHKGRCNLWLGIGKRGKKGEGAWEPYKSSPEGPDTGDNCEILCQECYKKRFLKSG